jgi:hypothetical protein
VPLVGGTKGGFMVLEAAPGGAGGAATLIACRGAVTVSGMIDAGGGGGTGGFDAILGGGIALRAAGAGGSGGNVVLQGLAVTVTGRVYANGGGGGAGTSGDDVVGFRGGDGTRSATVGAAGGASTGAEGAGGTGGVSGSIPTVGKKPPGGGTAGGGGGSIGFFQSYTPAGVTPTLTPTEASPPFGANRNINTR